jgi:hypothetical protein
MDLRLYTLEEANALIPCLEDLVEEARALDMQVQEAESHLEDLKIVWGENLNLEECPARPEYETRVADVRARRLRLQLHLQKFQELGVELKGLDLGLVDFYTLNGDRLVYLCWRAGEPEVTSWHTLHGGFQGRKPIPRFVREGQWG